MYAVLESCMIERWPHELAFKQKDCVFFAFSLLASFFETVSQAHLSCFIKRNKISCLNLLISLLKSKQ